MQIDWSGIRAAAISLNSVNAAAIQAGANLPPEEAERLRHRINKRALRERWLDKSKALALTAPTNAKPLSKPVLNGADSLAKRLASDADETKIGLSTATRRAAKTFQNMPGIHVIGRSQELRHITAAASHIHGWNDQKQPGINLAILNVAGGMQ